MRIYYTQGLCQREWNSSSMINIYIWLEIKDNFRQELYRMLPQKVILKQTNKKKNNNNLNYNNNSMLISLSQKIAQRILTSKKIIKVSGVRRATNRPRGIRIEKATIIRKWFFDIFLLSEECCLLVNRAIKFYRSISIMREIVFLMGFLKMVFEKHFYIFGTKIPHFDSMISDTSL